MKKILLVGVIAIGMIAASQQEASAWVKSRFGVGLNWDYQAGGNSLLWGAWRNGQPPGPEAYGAPQGGFQPQFGAPQFGPGAFQVAPQAFPAQGFMPQGPSFSQPMMPAAGIPQGIEPAVSYQGSPFQFANYPRPVYYYYTPSFYYGN